MTPTRCPCLSGSTYDECCGPLHRGERAAATAEALMRSRFSAFALHDLEHLRRTWHPSTRPAGLQLDAAVRWYRLDVIGTTRGGPADTRGTVEFQAYYRAPDGAGSQHEVSRFVREDGVWLYADAAT